MKQTSTKLKVACWIVAVGASWWWMHPFGTFPDKLQTSKETTYITSPLTENGLPHYTRWMNQQLEIDNAENAWIPLMAMADIEAPEWEQFICNKLNISLPSDTPKLQQLDNWIYQQAESHKRADGIFELRKSDLEAWSKDPLVQQWAEQMSPLLDQIPSIVQRGGLYVPLDESKLLWENMLYHLGPIREIACCLEDRCQIYLGHGQIDKAYQQWLVLEQYSAMLNKHTTVVAYLTCTATQKISNQCAMDILSYTPRDSKVRTQLLEFLHTRPASEALSKLRNAHNLERVSYLETAYAIIYNHEFAADFFECRNNSDIIQNISEHIIFAPQEVDLNQWMRNINLHYDKMVENTTFKGAIQYELHSDETSQYVDDLEDNYPWRIALHYALPPWKRPENSAKIATGILGLPILSRLTYRMATTEVFHAFTPYVDELEAWHSKHGCYPENISDIESIPADLLTKITALKLEYIISPDKQSWAWIERSCRNNPYVHCSHPRFDESEWLEAQHRARYMN